MAKNKPGVSKSEKIGTNIHASMEGSILVIKIDTSKTFGKSASGKTITVASSRGNKEVLESGIILGVNAYKYPDEE